jgi:hypothetical protein
MNLLLLFEFAMAFVWVMNTCGSSITKKLSGYIPMDAINQALLVPLSNFPVPFKALANQAKTNKKGDHRILYSAIGIIVAIPVIIGVVALLSSADQNFAMVMGKIAEYININTFGRYLLELLVGIPVACYVFGNIYGNSHNRYRDSFSKKGVDDSLASCRRLPLAVVRAPLFIFAIIYVIFFVSMGVYMFSAFGGGTADGFTYAEYARRGFFELCGVAAINLTIIIFVYLFVRRGAGEYPKSLRTLTTAISSMTLLLIVTAASKMLLYVNMYGLTRLRVYTLWFMVLLLAVFIVLIIWHIRPFNAGKPIAIAFAALVLCLFMSNTDGLIAKYNVEGYESGKFEEVDTEMLATLSDATLPWLAKLADEAPDEEMRNAAKTAITENIIIYSEDVYGESAEWRRWNLQSAMNTGGMEKYLTDL